MDKVVDKIFPILTSKKFIQSIVVLILAIILYKIVSSIINKASGKNIKNDKVSKKKKTYLRLFNSIFKYLIMFIAIVIILGIYGVNVTSILAGLGVVSVIAGLALQDALKDIIMGFNIIVDDYFVVGDVLKIGDIEGKVVELGFKSTKMKDILTGNIYTISNRNISEANVMSDILFMNVPLPYELKLKQSEEVLNEIVENIKKLDSVKDATLLGLNEFDSSAIIYKLKIQALPENRYTVKRASNREIKLVLEEHKIDIPYNQLDVHMK